MSSILDRKKEKKVKDVDASFGSGGMFTSSSQEQRRYVSLSHPPTHPPTHSFSTAKRRRSFEPPPSLPPTYLYPHSVVPTENGRKKFKVVYVVLESQYQSTLTAACTRINEKQENVCVECVG